MHRPLYRPVKRRNDLIVFKAHLGEKVNWLSNFCPCRVPFPIGGESGEEVMLFPSVEHAFQAIVLAHRDDWQMFACGGVFAGWKTFEAYCSLLPKRVWVPTAPCHKLVGWIAKMVANPKRFEAFGVRYRTRKFTDADKDELLGLLLKLKFSHRHNPWLTQQLLATGDRYLLEGPGRFGPPSRWEGKVEYATDAAGKPDDTVKELSGENVAGHCIMRRRAQLQRRGGCE